MRAARTASSCACARASSALEPRRAESACLRCGRETALRRAAGARDSGGERVRLLRASHESSGEGWVARLAAARLHLVSTG